MLYDCRGGGRTGEPGNLFPEGAALYLNNNTKM